MSDYDMARVDRLLNDWERRRAEIDSWSKEDQARAWASGSTTCKCRLPGFACSLHGTITTMDGIVKKRSQVAQESAATEPAEDPELAELERIEQRRKEALRAEMNRPAPARPTTQYLPAPRRW